jgi:hypothetical protein
MFRQLLVRSRVAPHQGGAGEPAFRLPSERRSQWHGPTLTQVMPSGDGAFAVEVSIPESHPTKVSPFATKADAEAWIAEHRRRVQSENEPSRWFRSSSSPGPAPGPSTARGVKQIPPTGCCPVREYVRSGGHGTQVRGLPSGNGGTSPKASGRGYDALVEAAP